MLNSLIFDLAEAEADLNVLLTKRIEVIGSHTKMFEEDMKTLGLHEEVYFSNTAMVGNTVHKILKHFKNGNYRLLRCLEDHPDLHKKHLEIWNILADIESHLSTPGKKTIEMREEAAQACEKYTKRFPVLFKRDMTRKMHVLSCNLPSDIRKNGDYYKYLKLEQEGERLHSELNKLERQFRTVRNQAQRYFLMLRELENKQKCDRSKLKERKKRITCRRRL